MRRGFMYFCAAFLAMIVNIASRFLLSKVIAFSVAVFIAYWIGHIVNFIVSDRFVFKGKEQRNTSTTFLKFTTVALAGLVVTFVVSILARTILEKLFPFWGLEMRETLAHITGIGCSFVFNYLGHIFFSFRNLRKQSQEDK